MTRLAPVIGDVTVPAGAQPVSPSWATWDIFKASCSLELRLLGCGESKKLEASKERDAGESPLQVPSCCLEPVAVEFLSRFKKLFF